VNIAIWGIGKFGKYIYGLLSGREEFTVSCFIDKNAKKCKEYDGIMVCTPEEFKIGQRPKIEAVLIAFLGGGEERNYLCGG